ncbi:MAG: hypothetical protein Q9220_002914 [cf. Caloplaca sp. 1 TL-2023]
MAGTRPESQNIFTTISYWRDIESLHAVAFGPAHRAAWDWWNSMSKKHPHIGLFHEVYVVPKGQWTTGYLNFPRFGMGQTRVGKNGGVGDGDPLVENVRSQWRSLYKGTDR